MVRHPTLMLASASLLTAAGCGCSFRGIDDVITFAGPTLANEHCWMPGSGLAMGTRLPVTPTDADTAVPETYVLTSSDPDVVDVGPGDGSVPVVLLLPGRATISVSSSTGRVDRFEVIVAGPTRAQLQDPVVAVFVDGAFAAPQPPTAQQGDPVWLHPEPNMQLVAGTPLELWIGLEDFAGAALAWSDEALELSGSGIRVEPAGPYTDVTIRGETAGPATVRVDAAAGRPLAELPVEVVTDPTPATIELGFVDMRPEAEGDSTLVGMARALGRNAAGTPIWQLPVRWSLSGEGVLQSWDAAAGCSDPPCPPHRPDVASLNAADGGDATSLRVCLTAALDVGDQSLSRSLKVVPGGGSIVDGPACGCACDGRGGVTTGLTWIAVALLSGLARWRHGQRVHGSGTRVQV